MHTISNIYIILDKKILAARLLEERIEFLLLIEMTLNKNWWLKISVKLCEFPASTTGAERPRVDGRQSLRLAVNFASGEIEQARSDLSAIVTNSQQGDD